MYWEYVWEVKNWIQNLLVWDQECIPYLPNGLDLHQFFDFINHPKAERMDDHQPMEAGLIDWIKQKAAPMNSCAELAW